MVAQFTGNPARTTRAWSVMLKFTMALLLGLALAVPVDAASPHKEKGPNCSDGIDNDGDELVDGDDPDCGGSDDGGTTGSNAVFHVAILTEGGTNPWSTADDPVNCAAYAPADGKSYSAQFPRHLQCVPQCWVPLGADALTDDISINVRTRQGRFIGLTIKGQDWIGGDGIMHESDEVVLDVAMPADLSADFTIPVNQDVTIYRLKGHLGGPRVGVAGVIQLGELMYSPCTLGTDCPSSGNPNYPDACLP